MSVEAKWGAVSYARSLLESLVAGDADEATQNAARLDLMQKESIAQAFQWMADTDKPLFDFNDHKYSGTWIIDDTQDNLTGMLFLVRPRGSNPSNAVWVQEDEFNKDKRYMKALGIVFPDIYIRSAGGSEISDLNDFYALAEYSNRILFSNRYAKEEND